MERKRRFSDKLTIPKPRLKINKGAGLASKAYKTLANAYRRRYCNGKARDLYEGEYHPLCANFEGPGTRMDLAEVHNYPPYNNIDACAHVHDMDYVKLKKEPNAEKRALLVQEADKKAIECFDKFPSEEPYYSLGKAGLFGKLTLDKLISAIRGKSTALYGTGLLDNLRKKALSNEELVKLTDNRANIISYPDLINYKNIDQVLGEHNAAIILYETKHNYGHWVAVIKRGDLIEHFDPYGYKPDEELSKIDINYRIKNGEYYPLLSYLYYKSPYKLSYNEYKLQKINKETATCGRWVALRVLLKDLSLKKFVKIFTSNKNINPDDLVTLITFYI